MTSPAPETAPVTETVPEEAPLVIRVLSGLESAHQFSFAHDIANATANLAGDVRKRPLTRLLESLIGELAAALEAEQEDGS